MNAMGIITAIIPESREVEAKVASGFTFSIYKVRVPNWKIQDGFFKIGDKIPLKVIEQDKFALYDFPFSDFVRK